MALQSWFSSYLMHGLEVFSLRDVSDYPFFQSRCRKKHGGGGNTRANRNAKIRIQLKGCTDFNIMPNVVCLLLVFLDSSVLRQCASSSKKDFIF